jgi:hypothetical protein
MVFWAGAVLVAAVAILFAKGSAEAYELFHGQVSQRPWPALTTVPLGAGDGSWFDPECL